MKRKSTQLFLLIFIPLFLCATKSNPTWMVKQYDGYEIEYTSEDIENINEYVILIDKGKSTVHEFFQNSFKSNFTVFIHPNRLSLDTTWQKDWDMPDFKSQCWMVASGVSDKVDIISPKFWDLESCEHSYANKLKTQQLITHELIHVYHGQQNRSPDFSNVKGIDWFVEGLATYASGQCDSARIASVKKASLEERTPYHLNKFWTGKLRYGQSATLVMYIEETYGREKLSELLIYNDITDLLNSLNTTESDLVNEWRGFLKSL